MYRRANRNQRRCEQYVQSWPEWLKEKVETIFCRHPTQELKGLHLQTLNKECLPLFLSELSKGNTMQSLEIRHKRDDDSILTPDILAALGQLTSLTCVIAEMAFMMCFALGCNHVKQTHFAERRTFRY